MTLCKWCNTEYHEDVQGYDVIHNSSVHISDSLKLRQVIALEEIAFSLDCMRQDHINRTSIG